MSGVSDWARWPQVDEADVAAVVEVLRSNRLSQLTSSEVAAFEQDLAACHGVDHCVAVSSGTAAIHLALLALGVAPGDDVAVPTHTFIGSATPILHVGATPVFIDVDLSSYCIDPASLQERITRTTRAIVAVHLNGRPADLESLRAIADRYGVALIEDAAQALGATHAGRRVGTFGDLGCLSFFESKAITTAEGGAIITSDGALAERVRRLRHHGEEGIPGTGHSHSIHLGFNYRLTAVQAALGRSQLRRLDQIVGASRRNAHRLTALLQGAPQIVLPRDTPGDSSAWWRYVWRLDSNVFEAGPTLVKRLQQRGIPAQQRYPIPLHMQPVFKDRAKEMECPVADRLGRELVALSVYPADEDQIEEMADIVLQELRFVS